MSNELRKERERQGVSLTKIACKAGLSPSTLSEFELSKRMPWPKARAELAKALGVLESVLFPGEESK